MARPFAPPEALTLALRRVHPRTLQVLAARLLEGRSRAATAQHWGVSVKAADVLLLRCARELVAALAGQAPPPPGDFGVEAAEAEQLALALEPGAHAPAPPDAAAPAAAVPPAVAGLAALLASLREAAPLVSQELRELERRDQTSPGHRARDWARRGAVLLVLALTFFFWWRERNKEQAPPRYEPRPANRAR